MRTLFSLLCAFIFIVSISWYVMYKNNPNKVCEPHPDKNMMGKYLKCWPGFDMPVDSFVDGYSPIEKKRYIENKRKKILMQEQGDE